MMFRLSCAVLFVCSQASVSAAQTPLLRGRWVAETVHALMSFDFRTGDTVWLLLPITALSGNGHGTYRYGHGQLVMRYADGSEDRARVTLRGDTIAVAFDGGRTWTATRIAAARGRRAPLHGTWAERDHDDQLTLTTYLPDGVFFTEAAIVRHYAVDTTTVMITGDERPMQLHVQVQGTDTALTPSGGPDMTFRRPRCTDPRFDPRTTFTSVCS
jgi:hypothetical protein